MERIIRGVDSSLTALYILTSANMHKRVYLEDLIERCVQFTKFQLTNTIYPSFDPVYRIDSKKGMLLVSLSWVFVCAPNMHRPAHQLVLSACALPANQLTAPVHVCTNRVQVSMCSSCAPVCYCYSYQLETAIQCHTSALAFSIPIFCLFVKLK